MKPNDLEPEQPALNATDCENIAAHIFEYLDSEMTPVDAERMRAHVTECNPCLGELSVDEMIKRVLKRSCAEQAPEHLRVRIKAQFTSVRYEF